ncbi:hypothetical protein ACH5RR_021388 [Cinchona calisaya]|uniref:Fe2OG dioxygenase domain-containing protein n=1 Tax=Cinchona calisaya TaxID=153742 RepID=A0ABD2ZI43_9GENT
MASLVSTWSSNVRSLPKNFVVPLEKRPGKPIPICKDIPVIDLGDSTKHRRADIVQQIIKASQDFGLFQVINHGVSEKMMIDAITVGKEFFQIPVEEKEKFCAESGENGCRVYTSSARHMTQDFKYWKDSLVHRCHPLEEYIKIFPDKPAQYREIMGPYSVKVRKLGIKILDLIYEGLGLTEENFDNYDLLLMIHNYPACPDPSLALGIDGHRDGNLVTILQQDVYGLQLFKDGQWLGVEPLPYAFVINIAFALEVISNGKLKSAVHRVITNSDCSRTSLANFVNIASDEMIEPAKSLISPSSPPVFRSFQFKEYLQVLSRNNSDSEATFQYFKIGSQDSK